MVRRRERSEAGRARLAERWAAAGGDQEPGAALACIGSLARDELGPCSDVDLVLVSDPALVPDPGPLATRLWYPLWDSGVTFDHAVRTPAECARVAVDDLSAAVGLLELRHLAGNAAVVDDARARVSAAWRRTAPARVPELLEATADRARLHGEGAYLVEPDLKHSRGGLRDMGLLRALAAAWLTDRPRLEVAAQHQLLLDVRDALQAAAGRSVERLLLSEGDEVAAHLGLASTDALRLQVSWCCRHITYELDQVLRSLQQAGTNSSRHPGRQQVHGQRRPQLSRERYGLVVHSTGEGSSEVALAAGTDARDPLVGLRAGVLAGRRGLPLSPTTAANIGRDTGPVPVPWPAPERTALIDLLACGADLVTVWESLDLAGAITTWIPAWAQIQCRPQHNPLHRFTVDRHSIETVAEARHLLNEVSRPDLLLLAALLHDIGKGTRSGAHHPAVGAPIAAQVVTDLGFAPRDVDVVKRLVGHHLVLAELATHRDPHDPVTVTHLLEAVGRDPQVLELLRCLTEADGRATGDGAWSSWRARLIYELADRGSACLDGGTAERSTRDVPDSPPPGQHPPAVGLAGSVAADGRARVRYRPMPGSVEVMVAAPDRPSLFADTAGLFARHRLSVRGATAATQQVATRDIAVATWQIEVDTIADLPDAAYLAGELDRLGRGGTELLATVRRRESRVRAVDSPVVRLLQSASRTAAVIEVRAHDRTGLLWSLGSALAGAGFSVRSAHIATLAGQAQDTFYVIEPDGTRPAVERGALAVTTLRAAARGHADRPTSTPAAAGGPPGPAPW